MGKRALKFAPGAQHDYSNSNYVILAALVEALAGKVARHTESPCNVLPEREHTTQCMGCRGARVRAQSFGAFMKERFWSRLGMQRTFVLEDHAMVRARAARAPVRAAPACGARSRAHLSAAGLRGSGLGCRPTRPRATSTRWRRRSTRGCACG